MLYAVNEFNGFFLKTSFKDANQKCVSGSWSCRDVHIAEKSESGSKAEVSQNLISERPLVTLTQDHFFFVYLTIL